MELASATQLLEAKQAAVAQCEAHRDSLAQQCLEPTLQADELQTRRALLALAQQALREAQQAVHEQQAVVATLQQATQQLHGESQQLEKLGDRAKQTQRREAARQEGRVRDDAEMRRKRTPL